MFNLIERYIAKHVILASLFILSLLVFLQALFGMLAESASVGRGSYQLADAFLFVGLMLPQRVLDFFPMGVLIGSLFGLGVLASNNELTVMRAAGMTTWKISFATVKASFVLMIGVLILSEIIAPVASKTALQLRTSALSDGKISHSETGLWAKRDNQIIHIASVLRNGKMYKVSIFQFDKNNRLNKLIEAKSAEIIDEVWYLFNVNKTHFKVKNNNKIEKTFIAKMQWKNPLDKDNIETLTLDPETLSFMGLVKYKKYLMDNQLNSHAVELAIWQRLFLPLSISVMMMLAASFLFGPMRDVSMGARVLTGVMLGFGFYLVKQSFGPISYLYGVSPFFGALFPILFFFILAIWLMKKSR